ncbi:uncharacterized protein LOC143292039 [Babylonia areolata]|uniref:uncharacterized protein LOC143292039 n=1 Tax=Babylonia areolata TaxID=304850 RepID=UPI003FCF2949
MDEVEETRRPILQMKRRKNRQTKTVLIFDEDARREYLTGFQKRKNQRRKKAKLENEKKLKEEKQALKQQVRDMVKKSDRHRLPEVEEFLNSTVHDLPEHTVTITDMSDRLTVPQQESSSDQQDSRQENEEVQVEEDSETLKKKRKKLMNKLAQVGNIPSTKKSKLKRLGKFKGGGRKGGSGGGGGGKKSKKNKSGIGNKKHKHKQM